MQQVEPDARFENFDRLYSDYIDRFHPADKENTMSKTDSRLAAFTEQQLILKESQLRRVQALKEAREVLSAHSFIGAAAVDAEALIRVAEYILDGSVY